MSINILQGFFPNVSLLMGQFWNLNQHPIIKPHKIQKEINLILSLKAWVKNKEQRMLL